MAVLSDLDTSSSHWKPSQTIFIDGVPTKIRDVIVHSISINDAEDPDLVVADPLWQWQQSEVGQWIMNMAVEKPYWVRQIDMNSYGYLYLVVARLKERDEMFWKLKWAGLR